MQRTVARLGAVGVAIGCYGIGMGSIPACKRASPSDPPTEADTDTDTDTDADTDADVDTDEPIEPGWEHCPDASIHVGDPAWTGRLLAGEQAVFCTWPLQYQPLDEAIGVKRRARLMPGAYRIPTVDTASAPWLLPVCFDDRGEGTPELSVGTLTREETEFLSGPELRLSGAFPIAGGSVQFDVTEAPGATEILVRPTQEFGRGARIRTCTGDCFDGDGDLAFSFCDGWVANTCDAFTFADGDLSLSQYHWVGPVGGGFAVITEAYGTWKGVPFAVTDYEQLTMAYGHHAFTRAAHVLFDAPIDGDCGLSVDEVAIDWTDRTATVLGCDGQPTATLAILAESHNYMGGACR